MEIKLFSVLHLMVAFQSLLTMVYLVFQRTSRLSNYFLASALLLLSIHFSYNFLIENEIYINLLVRLSCVYGFAYGPFLFLYIRSLLYNDYRFKKLQWLHLSPFLIGLISTLIGFSFCQYFTYGIFISMLGYSIASIWSWFKYRKILQKTTSQPDPHLSKWLRASNLIILLIIITDISQFLFGGFSIYHHYFSLETFTQILLLIFVLMVQYHTFFHPELFRKVTETDTLLFDKFTLTNKQEDEAVNTEKDLEEVNQFLMKDKIFLKPQLTIQELAKALNWPTRKLSRVINLHSGTNFSDYINKMRLDEACYRFKNQIDQNETISEVMYDCGFNSRSVFNSLFKSHTGYTPTAYKKKLL